MSQPNQASAKSITGCLLGTAIGDALGLPTEGLSRQKYAKRFAQLVSPNLLFGRGMISDDTEHACLTAQALIASGGDLDLFTKSLARQLRAWVLCLPAGTGLATLKACFRLLIGIPPSKSGVFSAGNGPAMRSPILGVCYGHDLPKLRELVRVSSLITHTDPKAEYSACAIALAAHFAANEKEFSPKKYLTALQDWLGQEAQELIDLIAKAVQSAAIRESCQEFVDSMGLPHGISGYIYHTVPAVLQAWFRHPEDYRIATLEIVKAGGDTDSTAALLGALIGARIGKDNIPEDWRSSILEWPRTLDWMEKLGARLVAVQCHQRSMPPLALSIPGILARNVFFLIIVLVHGVMRLFLRG